MRDLHCHILPSVDDGAGDMDDTLAMFRAARDAGVTSITCTPHCRDPYFDYLPMWRAFRAFEYEVRSIDETFPLQMGFEVNYHKLMELGLEWVERLHFDGSNEFLLELSVGASPSRFGDYERTIFDLQGLGYTVIIAHPERYVAIQKDLSLARELADMGCRCRCRRTSSKVDGWVVSDVRRCACSRRGSIPMRQATRIASRTTCCLPRS